MACSCCSYGVYCLDYGGLIMGHSDSCYEYDREHGSYMEERVKKIREELKDAPTKIVKIKLEMLDKYK